MPVKTILVYFVGATTCLGCITVGDGYLGVNGSVRQWVPSQPAGVGVTYLNSTMEAPPGTSPAQGCQVTLQPWFPEQAPRTERIGWPQRTSTDANGNFTLGRVSKPGSHDASLVVECPGVPPVVRRFRKTTQERLTALVIVPGHTH